MRQLHDDPPVALDQAALEILSEAQRDVRPTDTERERGLQRLLAATSAGSAEQAAGARDMRARRRRLRAVSLGAALTATWHLAAAHAVKLGVAAVVCGAAGTWYTVETQSAPVAIPVTESPAPPAITEVAVPAPDPVEGPQVRPVEPAEPSAPSVHPVDTAEEEAVKQRTPKPRRTAQAPPQATAPVPQPAAAPRAPLAAEARTLSRVNTLLRQNRNAEALGLLNENHAVVLVAEWQAARAIALCGAGPVQGEAAAVRFLTDYAASPLAGRVKRACKID